MRKCFASLSAVLLGLFVLVGSELTRVTVEAAESPRASRGETDVAGDARDLLDRGAAIYANQCASCHGDKGQGVADRYERAFGGTRTLSWLTRRIERTMPEEDPDLCVGEDAAAVAAYLHRMHYAPDAQSKRRTPPPRELHRLTAEQHRQSLADLLMSTSADRDGPSDDRRGLSAAFYRDGKLRGKPIDRRVLPDADLRFTPDHPLAERFDPKGHSLRLTGSLHAPRSGVYEFVIRSDRAVRLWLNDAGTRGGGGGNEFAQVDRAFIDGWVKSEGVDVYRGKMFLLGGRDYPLLLDFSARNQGVQRDVNPNQKDRPETYLSLRWITPGRADERVIESRYLSPMQSPAVFVSGAAFPPEDESRGFERGVGVSPTWLSAATRAASEASVAAAERYDRQAGERANEAPRARVYLEAILSRAVRRPLTDHERANWIEASLDRASSPREAEDGAATADGSTTDASPTHDPSGPEDAASGEAGFIASFLAVAVLKRYLSNHSSSVVTLRCW
ncbi:MAG: c-type cytochrome [Phycisphaeraceae bacterium]